MLVNLFKVIDVNMKITSVLILCMVSGLMLIPAIAQANIDCQAVILSILSQPESDRLNTEKINFYNQETYVPPNYGTPDSYYGSGTR
jgi:hypothetical protein